MLGGLASSFNNRWAGCFDHFEMAASHLDPNFHLMPGVGPRGLPATLAGEAMPTPAASFSVLPAEKPTYLKVVITEDRSDSILVPEARTRPGFLDPASRFLNKSYQAENGPKKFYFAAAATNREIEAPVEGSVIVTSGECHVVLKSRIPRTEAGKAVKAWAVMCKYGVSTCQPQAVLVRQEGVDDVVTQVYKVNYTDNAEFGCVVFRCTNETLTYAKEEYKVNELLTVFFHRSREDADAAPYPPVVTLNRLQDQNYVPMVPGQILQIIPNIGEVEIEGVEKQSCLAARGSESLSKSGSLWVYRFECVRVPELAEPLFLKGQQTCSVIIPPLLCDDKDVFAVITEPYKSVRVMCENLTSLRVRFARDIPVIKWPVRQVDIPTANTQTHELTMRFTRRLDSVNMLNDKGTCTVSCTLPGFGTHTPPAKK